MKAKLNIEPKNRPVKTLSWRTTKQLLLNSWLLPFLILSINTSNLTGQFYYDETKATRKDGFQLKISCDEYKTNIAIQVSYSDATMLSELMATQIHSETKFSSHEQENGHTYGKELNLFLEFKPGRTYYIKPVSFEACKECLEDWQTSFKENYPYKRPNKYEVKFWLQDNQSLLINDLARVLEPVGSIPDFYISDKAGGTFSVKCAEPSDLFQVHETGGDIVSLPLMKRIADAAYTANRGERFRGVLDIGVLPQGAVGYGSIVRTWFLRNNDTLISGSFSEFEFEVIEVIEGTKTEAEPNPVHKSLGVIPPGFRAIILKSDLKADGVDYRWGDHYLIAYAGTEEWPDWRNNLTQGIPIYDFPWRWIDPYRWLDEQMTEDDEDLLVFDLRVAPQYSFGRKVCEYVYRHYMKQFPKRPFHGIDKFPAKLFVCGHSLGGGIAAYASGMLGVRGFGFNPAALASGMQAIRDEGVPSPELYFTNVCASEDVVSLITPLFPKGELLGDIIVVQDKPGGIIEQHKLSHLNTEVILDYKPPKKNRSENGNDK